jgi:hypothetical protein
MNFNPPSFFTSKGDLDFREITALTFESRGRSPEPSTWPMMLLGFAGPGFAGYRRRKELTALRASDRAVSKQTTSSRSPKIQRLEGKQRFGQLSDALGDFRMCNDFGNHIYMTATCARSARRAFQYGFGCPFGRVRDVDRGVRFVQIAVIHVGVAIGSNRPMACVPIRSRNGRERQGAVLYRTRSVRGSP